MRLPTANGVLEILVSYDGPESPVDFIISSAGYVPNIGICCSWMLIQSNLTAFVPSTTYGAVASRALKRLLAVIRGAAFFEKVNAELNVELKMLELPVYPLLSNGREVLASTLTASAAKYSSPKPKT